AQVYGFAKQSGGGVVIETKLGEGTTIRVFLPKAQRRASEAAPVTAAPETYPGTIARVLLVDDDSQVREVTSAMLADMGCDVIEVGSGAAALELLDQSTFDLAVFDFAMPGMNGGELARQVQTRHPSLPVLFVTGYADLAALKDVGEDRIVQKPYREGELERKVRRALHIP
ncbi:MAG: response regulator, partial [Bosea sp. (in: a-proteobacteria)]